MSGYLKLIGILLAIASCTSQVKTPSEETITASDSIIQVPQATKPIENVRPYAGNYISGEYPDGYYQLLKITDKHRNQYEVQFTASEVKERPACSFTGSGSVINDTLKVPLEWNDKTVQMTLFLRNDTILVFTENFDDRFALNYYCSGGASLTGDYARSRTQGLEP